MSKFFVVFTFMIFPLLQACGGNLSIDGPNAELKNTIPNEFYYKSKGNCTTNDLLFEHLQAVVLLSDSTSSIFLTAQQKIFLHRDGTFDFEYREFDLNQEVYKTKFKSTYQKSSENNSILLQNLGVGTFYQDNGQYFLDVQYQVSFNSTLLKDKTAKFKIVNKEQGLDTNRLEYCQNPPP